MSFREIKGNSKSIDFLRHTFLNHKESLLYLFYGPEGIGKRLIAHNLAKAINCLKKRDFEPCDECFSCRKIDTANHPDVFYILPDSSGSIKIEQIRALKEKVYLKTYEAKKKIFIIDNAEKLTLEAANACLKIMEEPPLDSLIILISSKPRLIISTILSRCQRIGFVPLEKKELEHILLTDFKLNENLAHYLAYFCEGRIGKAISLSKEPDVLLQKNSIIDESLSFSSLPDNREINKDKLKKNLEILLSWFRDLYLVKSGIGFKELINLDRKDQIIKQAPRYSYIELEGILDFLSEGFVFLDRNINPKLLWSNIKVRILR